MRDSNWDLDLRAGELGESKVADLLHADTIEVKTDKRWKDTGNLFIEYSCWRNATQKWEDSGILTSKATHWAFVLDETVLIVSKGLLFDVIEKFGRPISNNMMPNPSKGYLITPNQLINYPRVMNEKFDTSGEHYKNYMEQEYPI
jgi:hypothetical protein